jgi:hypothetical protein
MSRYNYESAMEQIEAYSKKAADGIRPYLISADLEAYKRFLNQMYHYTLTSGVKLKTLAKTSPTQDLRDYFNHMYLEERNHYMLAQQDLKGFGLTPTKETPQTVQDFNNFWESLADKNIAAYLAALYIFENVAEQAGSEVKEMLQRLSIEKNQRRWLSIHVEVDISHGAEIKEVLEKYLANDFDAAVDAAREASDRWIAVSATPFFTHKDS